MSRIRSGQVRFTHYGDIHDNRASCPEGGHTFEIMVSNTSDTVAFIEDGQIDYVMDEGKFIALVDAIKLLKEKWKV